MIDPEELLQLPVTQVPVDVLRPACSPRLRGEDRQHVRRLAGSVDPLPPIIVDRATMRVIDGMHRLLAVTMRGDKVIDVRFFDGDEMSAFVLAVRTNVSHGLPLSLSERKSAASRILAGYPQWSDRTIAQAAGLAPKTVAELRRRSTAQEHQLDARIGRDGRLRPVNGAQRRAVAAQVMREHPAASLREVARRAGISPETARRVRAALGAPPAAAAHGPAVAGSVLALDHRPAAPPRGNEADLVRDLLRSLSADPAIRLSEAGRVTLRALSASLLMHSQRGQLAEALPQHALANIALAAHSCASIWQEFGRLVEARPAGAVGGQ